MVKVPDIIYNANLKKHLMKRSEYGRIIAPFKAREVFKDEFFTNTPPSIFIGSALPHPQVNVGILAPPEKKEDVWLYDAQKYWSEKGFNIYQIMEFRASLINSRFRTDVNAARENSRFLELAKEIAMSSKPVDTEVKLKKKIKLRINFDDVALPMGPRGNLIKLDIGNTNILQRVDKVYFDTDMKATDAMNYLNEYGLDEQKISQLLSIGVMGQKKRRVLVPTRWSITATDSILGNLLLKKIKEYKILEDYRFFYGHYLGNYYFVLFFPSIYNYELFETYLPGSFWNPTDKINMETDFEPFKGRTKYAQNTVGGFYATRLGIFEYLNNIKRQASVLVVRVETPDYFLGLGVWVVREAIRKTLMNKPLEFDEKNKAIEFFKNQIFEKFRLEVSETLEHSKLLAAIKQKKLFEF